MSCDAYYKVHPEPDTGGDRCENREIEANTARSVALLAFSTMLFGIINLFVAGWTIKRFGVKASLSITVFWPAVRLFVQTIGVIVGGSAGILIIQSSQIITVIGGPTGYVLSLNSFVTEIVENRERTGTLGRLQGCTMFGTSIGFLAGGIISDQFGIVMPFKVAAGLFMISWLYVLIFLPYIPKHQPPATPRTTSGMLKYFGPLKMFAPQKWVLQSGKTQMEYGTLLLGFGVFFGVLATGYIPALLQMYSTNNFGFGTTENGALISLYSLLRGIFLTFAFPKIISHGRKWLDSYKEPRAADPSLVEDSAIPELPTEPSEFASGATINQEDEPVEPPKPSDETETFAFDLWYAKYSLAADGIFTGLATFIREGWQFYLVAAFLPFASGTGAAAKGTILQMCPPEERIDALAGITLVENMAILSTSMNNSFPKNIVDRVTTNAYPYVSSVRFRPHLCGFGRN